MITQNNQKATVKQGTKIPVQTIVNNTVSVQFVDAVLELDVTPQITAEGTVYMDVTVENDQIDQAIPRVQGIPAIDTQSAETKVTVNDGATVVIGGIIVTNQQTDIEAGSAVRQHPGGGQSVQTHDSELDVAGIALLPDASDHAELVGGRRGCGSNAIERGRQIANESFKPEPNGSAPVFLFCLGRGCLSGFAPSQYSLPLRISREARGCCWSSTIKRTLFTDSRYTFQAQEEVFERPSQIAKEGLIARSRGGATAAPRRVSACLYPSPFDRGAVVSYQRSRQRPRALGAR